MASSSFSRTQTVAWTAWIIASMFYGYQYILRVMPNVMLNDILQQFQIDAAAFGQFSGVYYIGYSLMHLPIGILLDRLGPRKVMSGCILLTAVGLLPLVFAKHWAYPLIGRILVGMGSSGAILGVFKIVRMAFTENRFPRMLSFSVTIGLIGAIYGGGPVSFMKDHLGFETVALVFAGAGILLAAVTYWIVPDLKSGPQTSAISNIKEVLKNGRVVWTCVFAGLMVGPLEGFADVWGTTFLKKVYGFDGALAASLPSTIFIGMCFGAPVLTWIAGRIGSYLAAIIGAGTIMAAVFFAMVASPVSQNLIGACFALVGICSAYQILSIYKASTYVREEAAGLTTALANMIIMIFGYAFHSIIGAIVQSMGGADQADALRAGIFFIPVCLAIGTGGFFYLYTKEKKQSSEVK